MNRNGNPLIERVALAIPEQRLELGLSVSETARLSGVSRPTVAKMMRGQRVSAKSLLQVARTLATLKGYVAPSEASLDLLLDNLLARSSS
jgi:transcriptional regulator with XRE-family HTH domain